MKRSTSWFKVALVLLMAGCIPSVHPLYTEQDLVFDPALVGEWSAKDSKETWTFSKAGEKEYKLVYVDEKGKKGEFSAHLAKFDGKMFLDLYPQEPDLKDANDYYKAHLMPVHTFLRVDQVQPTLQMMAMSPDWIKKFLEATPDALKHEKVNDGVLITAQPKDLQAFLIKHLDTKEAWGEPMEMTKKAAAKE